MESNIYKSISISGMTNMGAGVARLPSGAVAFVYGAVDGDIADIEITERHGKYFIGKLVSLRSPSPHRIAADCTDAFEHGCGGCVFRHITYEHELQIKLDFIKSAFKKAGIDASPKEILTAGCAETRTKLRVPVSSSGVSGYYRRASRDIVPSSRCLLHSADADALREYVADLIGCGRLYAIDEICIRRSDSGDMMLILHISGDGRDASQNESLKLISEQIKMKFPNVKSIFIKLGGEYIHVFGDMHLRDKLAGCEFLISPASFYQVNHGGAEILYKKTAELCRLRDGDMLADLYCGTGTIGISVIKSSGVNASLTGIDIVPSAVDDAVRNAEINGVPARFICADATSYAEHADTVILDPPRVGCNKALIEYLISSKPARIVYVSCEPAALARDASLLLRGGYSISELCAVDMFPRTSHVETVCLMSRVKE